MDAITNKDTRTFPIDDATFNSLILDRYLKKLTEDEFEDFLYELNRVNRKRFYELKMRKKIDEICMDLGDKITPEEIKCRLFGDMSNNS